MLVVSSTTMSAARAFVVFVLVQHSSWLLAGCLPTTPAPTRPHHNHTRTPNETASPSTSLTLSQSETDSIATVTRTEDTKSFAASFTRTRMWTSSNSTSPSFTSTESYAGKVWRCRGLPATLQATLVSPPGASFPLGVATLIKLSSDVLSTSGYVIELNITSCHTYSTATNLAQFASKPTLTSNESLTTVADVVRYILDEQSDVTASGAAFNTNLLPFSVLVNNNPAMVVWTVTAPTRATLSLGPVANVGSPTTEILALTIPSQAFLPAPPSPPAFTVNVLPPEEPVVQLAQVVIQQVLMAFVTSVAIVTSDAQNPMTIARLNAVQSAQSCPRYISSDRLDVNFARLLVGSEADARFATGGLVVSLALLVCAGLGHYLAAALALGVSTDTSLGMALGTVRFPTLLFPVATLLYQGIVTASVSLLTVTQSLTFSYFAVCMLVFAMALPLVVLVATNGPTFHPLMLRANTEDPGVRTSRARLWIVGVGMWINRTSKTHYREMFRGMFQQYLPNRQWFAAIEMTFSFAFGVLDASGPTSTVPCLIVAALETALHWGYVVVVIGAHPTHTPIAFVLTIAGGMLNLVGSALFTVNTIFPRPQLTQVASWVIVVASIIPTTRAVCALVQWLWFWHRRGAFEQAARRWVRDSIRKNRVDELHQVRELLISDVLEGRTAATNFGGTVGAATVHHRAEAATAATGVKGEAAADGGGESDDEEVLKVKHCDERATQAIASSVQSKANWVVSEEDEAYLVERTGLSKRELMLTI